MVGHRFHLSHRNVSSDSRNAKDSILILWAPNNVSAFLADCYSQVSVCSQLGSGRLSLNALCCVPVLALWEGGDAKGSRLWYSSLAKVFNLSKHVIGDGAMILHRLFDHNSFWEDAVLSLWVASAIGTTGVV